MVLQLLLPAATVYPDREVWQLAGDGGFAMMNQELSYYGSLQHACFEYCIY